MATKMDGQRGWRVRMTLVYKGQQWVEDYYPNTTNVSHAAAAAMKLLTARELLFSTGESIVNVSLIDSLGTSICLFNR